MDTDFSSSVWKGPSHHIFTSNKLNGLLNSGLILYPYQSRVDSGVVSFRKYRRLSKKTETCLWRNGMSTLAIEVEPLAIDVSCSDDSLTAVLADGREISVPLVWFPRLQKATQEERREWRLIGGG